MSQRGVIFGEFLRRSVISRILWFRRIRVHKGPETQEHAEEESSDDGPGFQHDSHLENKTRVFIYLHKLMHVRGLRSVKRLNRSGKGASERQQVGKRKSVFDMHVVVV